MRILYYSTMNESISVTEIGEAYVEDNDGRICVCISSPVTDVLSVVCKDKADAESIINALFAEGKVDLTGYTVEED